MARSRARSRKGKQQKVGFIISLVEDVPSMPGSWPVEIPTSMTHIFRVKPLPNPDEAVETTNPFVSTGPLEMVEHVFQLEKIAFCDVAVEVPAGGPDHYVPHNISDSRKVPSAARLDFSTPARLRSSCSTFREAELSGCVRPPSLTSGNGFAGKTTGPLPHRWLPSASTGLSSSRSLSPEYAHSPNSVNLSRRSSLAVTELESSRAPSPSVSSSQDSSLSSVEALDLVPRPISLSRLPFQDDAYIRFGDRALPAAHLQAPQCSPHRHLHPYGYLPPPDLYQHPAHLGHREVMQRPIPLGHPQHHNHPVDIRLQRSGEETYPNGLAVPNHATNARPGAPHYDPTSLASRGVPPIQLDLQYPQMPGNPAMHPLQHGPCSMPLVSPLPHLRSDAPEIWGHHPAHGPYLHPPSLPPSQAFRDFMADLGPTGQPMVPLLPPLPPVHAPPLRSVPPHVIGFSVPLRPLGYRAAARERNWTAHFEALGSRGRRKKNSRKNTETEEPEIKRTEVYQCPMCDRAFERRNGLAIHMKWHYKDHSEDSYMKGLGITIPPLNLPRPLYIPQDVTMAHSSSSQPSLALESAPSSSTLSNDASPPMGCLQLSEAAPPPTRAASPADGFLLSITTLDSMPGPITPLATPPPSPGSSSFRPSSLLHLSAGDVLSTGSGRARSNSTRSMWDLFGSDD